MIVRFSTAREDFPPNLEQLTIAHVVLYFSRRDSHSFEVPVTHLYFTEAGGPGPVGGGRAPLRRQLLRHGDGGRARGLHHLRQGPSRRFSGLHQSGLPAREMSSRGLYH